MTWSGALVAGLARVALVVLLVVTGAWLLVEAAPGSPGEKVARAAGAMPADDGALGPAARRALLDRLALERGESGSLVQRMGRRLGGLARGDLGQSWRDGGSVGARVAAALAPTAWVCGLALLLAALVGLALGGCQARFAGGAVDRVLAGGAALALAVPVAWLALLLYRAAGRPAALPAVLALAAVPAAVVARHARAALVAAAAQPWAVAARARGVSPTRLVAVHALRAASADLMPLLPPLVAYLLGASLVVEQVFAVHGLGALLAGAAAWGDAPVVVGVAAAASVLIALASLAADLSQKALDPRRRAQ